MGCLWVGWSCVGPEVVHWRLDVAYWVSEDSQEVEAKLTHVREVFVLNLKTNNLEQERKQHYPDKEEHCEVLDVQQDTSDQLDQLVETFIDSQVEQGLDSQLESQQRVDHNPEDNHVDWADVLQSLPVWDGGASIGDSEEEVDEVGEAVEDVKVVPCFAEVVLGSLKFDLDVLVENQQHLACETNEYAYSDKGGVVISDKQLRVVGQDVKQNVNQELFLNCALRSQELWIDDVFHSRLFFNRIGELRVNRRNQSVNFCLVQILVTLDSRYLTHVTNFVNQALLTPQFDHLQLD